MSAGRNALPGDGYSLPRGADAVPDICHSVSAEFDPVPNDGDCLSAAGDHVPQRGHHLPRAGDGMSADHHAMYERGDGLPRGRHPVSCCRHAMPAAGDGVRATCAGSNLCNDDLGLFGHKSGHRRRTGLCGHRCEMPLTNDADREELKTLRAYAINEAQWYNAGRPNNIGRPF